MHLDAQRPDLLEDYLKQQGWLSDNEIITLIEKPGEGNMNYTLRVRTNAQSLIVKQARPYVEKYPQIPAPARRAVIEAQFYEMIERFPDLQAFMPELSGKDDENCVLVLQDLGSSSDYTFLYQPGQTLTEPEIVSLVRFVSLLHNRFTIVLPDMRFENRAMRALNHEHLFQYPFMVDTGFSLDTIQPGLQEAAMPYKTDEALKRVVRQLGEIYLGQASTASGRTLLHGDYYPGSWLKTTAGVKVIDPEFCFYGPPEFELGVMLAHLKMARQPQPVIDLALAQYDRPNRFDERLQHAFAGVEILRRLIGLAQLPLSLDLTEKQTLMQEARSMLVD